MNRRAFLKLSGLVAASSALEARPLAAALRPADAVPQRTLGLGGEPTRAAMRLTVHAPGTYQLVGQVRLDEPQIEIRGIAHPRRISWSGGDTGERPLAEFTAFVHLDRPGLTPPILVHGGHLEALTLQPVAFA